MKVKTKELYDEFTPVEITIRFESKDELGKFYAVISHSDVENAADLVDEFRIIRQSIKDETDINSWYTEYFYKFNNGLSARG